MIVWRPPTVESNLYKVATAIANGKAPASIAPYFAGGRLLGLSKPNGGIRPVVVGEALRRLVGKLLLTQKMATGAVEKHFAPQRQADAAAPVPAHPVAAQLGVGIKGGLEEMVHAVSVALQSHPAGDAASALADAAGAGARVAAVAAGQDAATVEAAAAKAAASVEDGVWICISVDFKNFFN